MYQRPSQTRRNSLESLGQHAKRSSLRQLVFELLENRTLLNADMSFVELRLPEYSALNSAPADTNSPTQNNSAEQNGVRLEMINTTSPDAAEPAVDDVVLLRLSLSADAAVQWEQEFASTVTFDSNVVELSGMGSRANEDANGDEIEARTNDQVTYLVHALNRSSQAARDISLEIPFRVIAAGAANFTASVSPIPRDYSGLSGQHLLGGGAAGDRRVISVVDAVHLQSAPIAYNWEVQSAGQKFTGPRVSNETIWLVRPVAPPLNSVPQYDEPQPFANARSLRAAPQESAFAASSQDTALSNSELSTRSSNWVLSGDALWNRHRQLLVADGDRGIGSRRTPGTAAAGLTSTLLRDASDSKGGRSAEQVVEVTHHDRHGLDKVQVSGIAGLITDTGSSRLLDDDASVQRVTVLRPEDCDAVLAEWKLRANSSTSSKSRSNTANAK
jgi:hypothetical protein